MKQLQATVAMQLQQEETEPLMLMVINQEEKWRRWKCFDDSVVSFNREGQLMEMMALSEAKRRQLCVVRVIVVEREGAVSLGMMICLWVKETLA